VAGTFEITEEGEAAFLFRLPSGDGTVVAVSPKFTTIKEVVHGIEAGVKTRQRGLLWITPPVPLIRARSAPPVQGAN
jgi:uncharacterized protein